MFKSLRHQFDPLDREILERAFCAAWTAIQEIEPSVGDVESNESLAAILHRKLIEIAQTKNLSDEETLRDALLASLNGSTQEALGTATLRPFTL
jgi:hypothetical protein